MNARERVERTLNRQKVDAVPLDMGGSVLTGMHVSSASGSPWHTGQDH
jgi:hypothetical protein